MSKYEGWRISRWSTPVVDVERLAMVSLADVGGELVIVSESVRAPGRPRWRVRFKHYPAYRNIDEAYRTDLWAWLDASSQRLGFTFTVEESSPLASWGTVYLHEVAPSIRHFVISTEDDVVEVLSTAEPVWEVLDGAASSEPVPGKARHLYAGEDDEEIERLVEDLKARSSPSDVNQ